MPSSQASRPLPVLPIAIITGIFLFGLNALHLQLGRNGYLDSIKPLLVDEPRFFPGTEHLIRRHYTGIAPLDGFLASLNVVWTNVFDLSRPELTLFAFNFAGQIVPFILVVMIESQRVAKFSPLLK